MKRLGLILTVLVSVFYNATAQEIYSLRKCIETGLERNHSIRITRNEEQIASNNVTPGNAGYLPVVDLSTGINGTNYNYQYDYTDGTSADANGIHAENANVGLNLNWTIFDGFGIQTNYAKLKELKQMGELNTRIVIEDFVAEISSEYYNLIRQQIRLNNLRSAVNLSKERLRIVEERYYIGSMSSLDLLQAKAYFNEDSSRLLTQFEAVQTSRIRLCEIMAINQVNKEICVTDSIIYPNPDLNENDIRDKMMTTNPILLASQKDKTLSELDYKKVLSRNYPYLKLNAGYGYASDWYGTGTTDLQKRLGFNYGLTLGFTLFDGMNRRREQRNARIEIENSELRIQQLKESLDAKYATFWMAYQSNLKLWSLEKENLVTARAHYANANERYKLGELSGIELREAQNSLLEAEERLSIAEYNIKLCEISLVQLSGQILEYFYE
jgi:outer membrane protein TolC